MLINILIVLFCIAADQLTKYLVDVYLKSSATFPLIENVLHLTYVENRGAAFGMLADKRWIFMTASVIGIAAVAFYLFKLTKAYPNSWLNRISLCLIVGGGIGNMIDRVARGYVIDFIDCRFIDFYVFNGADSFVCVGCALFMLSVILDEIREKKQKNEVMSSENNKASGTGASSEEKGDGN